MEIGTNDWSNFLTDQASASEMDLDRPQNRLFSAHAIELINWNQTINITTITDPIEVASNHFLDSLVPAKVIPPGAAMLDIGSGGGFPGIPLKVLLPTLSVTLIDASRKKVSFLKHIIRTLKLDNIEALHMRAQDLAVHPSYINRFDVIICRALSSLEYFVCLALPLLADGGIVIAMKGKIDRAELDNLRYNVLEKINAVGSVNRKFTISIERYSLPLLDSERSIITFR